MLDCESKPGMRHRQRTRTGMATVHSKYWDACSGRESGGTVHNAGSILISRVSHHIGGGRRMDVHLKQVIDLSPLYLDSVQTPGLGNITCLQCLCRDSIPDAVRCQQLRWIRGRRDLRSLRGFRGMATDRSRTYAHPSCRCQEVDRRRVRIRRLRGP